MGKRKQRTNEDTSDVATGLEHAWPSAPVRNPRYVLYCDNFESSRRYVVNSYACYAIKKILDAIIDGREYDVVKDTVKVGDIDIRSDQLEEILAHKYTKDEQAYELSVPYPQDIENFKSGRRMRTVAATESDAPPKMVVPKVDRTGMMTIQDICTELKMEPRIARGMLRKAKVIKPSGGWAWDKNGTDEIRKMLK